MAPTSANQKRLRVAVIDLYGGEPNQGMRCIRGLIEENSGRWDGVTLDYEIFETRSNRAVPGLDYDVFISTGGPGSPFDGVGKPWEENYFQWLRALWRHNRESGESPRHAFFICHSFQMMCRFFRLGEVVRRRSESFGIFPVHKAQAGAQDVLFAGLDDPFYAADFRNWQVVLPDRKALRALNASILAIEKLRPHVELERAVMGIRLSREIVGVQFHPEADAEGMLRHFSEARRRAHIIAEHGEEKYGRIIRRLEDPDYLDRTYRTVVPAFLKGAVEARVGRAGYTDVIPRVPGDLW